MSRRKRALITCCVVVVVLFGALAGYLGYLNSLIHRIHVLGLTSAQTSGALAGTENVLLVGSTSRCALKVQNPAYGLCSEGVTGVNSDVVMVLHLNWTTHAVSILSIPRDLFVPNARSNGANKVDAALVQGPSQLVTAVKEDLGIPIQHYVELNFDSFIGVVNALGGIDMYFPEPVFDAYSGLLVTSPGCVHLDGTRALQVVRARHLQYKGADVTTSYYRDWPYDPQSDLSRIRRDHEFLRVLAAAVAHQGLGNPLTDRELVASVAPQLTVDGGMSVSDMARLLLAFHSVNINSAPQLTTPVMVSAASEYEYQGYYYGNVEFPSEPQDRQALDRVLGVKTGIDTITGKQLPKPAKVKVSVLNGTGTTDQAAQTVSSLHSLGFDTVGVGDTTAAGGQSETVVYYSNQSAEPAAEAVAGSMTGAVVMARGATSDGAQVTVVTGTDFSVNVPSAAQPSAVALGSTAGSSTAATSSASTFSPPTSASEPLEPWDPRACGASGGAGH